jgi:hypothetical protein
MADDQGAVIIRDDTGTEHEFPAGFDPKKAAAIVRQKAAPAQPGPAFANVQAGASSVTPTTARSAGESKAEYFDRLAGGPSLQQGLQNQQQMAVGAAKGAGSTAFGIGKMLHDYTPLGRVSDAIAPGAFEVANRPPELAPTNRAQQVGHTAEQVGEFFIPGAAATTAGKVGRVAADAGLALAQSGSPTQAGVTGAITAVLPGGGAAKKVAGALQESAQSTMAQALGATKEWAKSEAEKLAPEMLKRGIGGSIQSMRTLARDTAAKAGQNLADAYTTAAAAGETVPGDIIRGNIQLARDSLHATTPTGAKLAVPGYEGAVAHLDKLHEFVGQLGDDIPVDKAAFVKKAWDRIVSSAGLFGPKATASASDSAQAWATREAAGSFREILNTNPTIEALNKEAGFWIGMRDVLDATKLRKVAQGGGLVKAGAATVGAGVGAATGDSYSDRAVKGVLGGLAGQQFVKLVQSPAFRSQVSAPLKQYLAEALASGSAARVTGATGRILAALPAQVTQ